MPLLRTPLLGELLAWLYLHPDDTWSVTDLARRFGSSPSTVSREADRLVDSGLITEQRRGNLRLLQADVRGPLARPLTDLLALTYGPKAVLGDVLASVPGVDEAYIYGSWAARYLGEPGPVPRDIDVLVVGNADDDDFFRRRAGCGAAPWARGQCSSGVVGDVAWQARGSILSLGAFASACGHRYRGALSMRWEQGRARLDGMIARGELERVPASRAHADLLVGQASQHLRAAQAITSIDPTGAYQLLYDAARKALNAVLENEGLRATSKGGHIAVLEAVSAQLDPPLGGILRPFDRMRRRRNQDQMSPF